jgi:hypothetical protein
MSIESPKRFLSSYRDGVTRFLSLSFFQNIMFPWSSDNLIGAILNFGKLGDDIQSSWYTPVSPVFTSFQRFTVHTWITGKFATGVIDTGRWQMVSAKPLVNYDSNIRLPAP